jgi:hypothetical protein
MKRQMVEQKRLARLVKRATAKATKMKCSLEGNEALSCTKNTSSKTGSGRAKKVSKLSSPVFLSPELKLPKGFDRISNDDGTENPKFSYFDAMFDSHATLQYLQNGRKGELYQKTMDEAKREFCYVITQAIKQTNFGGCIRQVYMTPNESRADSASSQISQASQPRYTRCMHQCSACGPGHLRASQTCYCRYLPASYRTHVLLRNADQ